MMGRSIHGATCGNTQATSIFTDESNPKERLTALTKRKYEIETELSQQYDVLSANSIDLTSPLTDADGFPRADVPDLASVRVARARICELKNDLRATIDQLSQTLQILMPTKAGSPICPPIIRSTTNGFSSGSLKAFAQVDLVAPNSPAQQAGLQVGDQIVRFGPLDYHNHDDLQALGKLVPRAEGKWINVVCFRLAEGKGRTMISMELKPHSGWGGRGLLGLSHPRLSRVFRNSQVPHHPDGMLG
ncbi:uncharacterized protein VP01_2257g4 [Puccinia sorghi]|uniref:Probable 26S proteasome regulatory subunit p27 n=1 Tax=Puccinia sorghi TaxID=27349 RepID=A0A0L6VA94_9BASI|nr:uncharacterized protein VP01_2257g4 [Puccinia sorghi]